MKLLTEIEFESDLKEFAKVIDKVKKCDVVANFERVVVGSDGTPHTMQEAESLCKDVKVILNINQADGFAYMTIESKDKGGLQKLKFFWERLLAKSTYGFLNQKPCDNLLRISAICDEVDKNGLVYAMQAINPIFMSIDGEKMDMLLTPENVGFEISMLSKDEVDYAAFLEEEARREEERMNRDENQSDDEDEVAANFMKVDMPFSV